MRRRLNGAGFCWTFSSTEGLWAGRRAHHTQRRPQARTDYRRSSPQGEKASLIVFYKEIEFEKDAAEVKDGDDPTSSAWLARGYWVFNAEQVEGYEQPEKPPVAEIERNERVEAFMADTGIETKWGGHSAFYRPSEDIIQMPEQGLFTGTDTTTATEALYATWLHEGVHATGHKSRLDRNFAGRFGTQERSAEELVAELGSAFLCADLSVTTTSPDIDERRLHDGCLSNPRPTAMH